MIAPTAATQGVYNRVNTKKERAARGVNLRERRRQRRGVRAGEHSQSADDGLLGGKAGDKGTGGSPICKTQRRKDGGNELADAAQHGSFAILHIVEAEIEALQHPDDDGGQQDDGKGPF